MYILAKSDTLMYQGQKEYPKLPMKFCYHAGGRKDCLNTSDRADQIQQFISSILILAILVHYFMKTKHDSAA